MADITTTLNRTLKGEFEDQEQSHKQSFSKLDEWIRWRLRIVLWKHCKGAKGISGIMYHFRWPDKFFTEPRLFSLEAAHAQLLQSSRS